MSNEVIIEQWKEPIYSEKYDRFKNKNVSKFEKFILAAFFPDLYFYDSGFIHRKCIKLLNTSTGKTRIIKEKFKFMGGKTK